MLFNIQMFILLKVNRIYKNAYIYGSFHLPILQDLPNSSQKQENAFNPFISIKNNHLTYPYRATLSRQI
jgi:hypothetical protein